MRWGALLGIAAAIPSLVYLRGFTVDDALIHAGHFEPETGAIACRKFLDLALPPSAIFVANHESALGVLRVTRGCLPLMTNNPGSYILNIGSVAGRVAYEGGAAYCGAKAAELKITQALRLELSGTGVRVGTIDPGMAETEFSVVRFNGDTERAKKVYEGVIPLAAEDIAEALVWAASRPPHVCIDEMLIKCTDQAAIHKVHRRPAK